MTLDLSFNLKEVISKRVSNTFHFFALIFLYANELRWIPSGQATEYLLPIGLIHICALISYTCFVFFTFNHYKVISPLIFFITSYVPVKIYGLIIFTLFHFITYPILVTQRWQEQYSAHVNTLGFVLIYVSMIIILILTKNKMKL